MVNLKNSTGVIKQCPTGFCGTMFLCGVLVPLWRRDFKGLTIVFICSICTVGLTWFVFPFIYNKMYIKRLLAQNFVPADDFSKATLQQMGISIAK